MKRAFLLLTFLAGCAALKGQGRLNEPGGVSFRQYPTATPPIVSAADLDNRTDHEIEADVICSLFEYRGLRVPAHTRQGFVFVDDQVCELERWRIVK